VIVPCIVASLLTEQQPAGVYPQRLTEPSQRWHAGSLAPLLNPQHRKLRDAGKLTELRLCHRLALTGLSQSLANTVHRHLPSSYE